MLTKNPILAAFILCLASLCIFQTQAHNNPHEDVHVIFDVGGVLVQTSGAHKISGVKKFILYALTHNPLTMKKSIKEKLFSFLEKIKSRHPDEVDARDEHGTQLPQIFCDWMKGTYTPEELLTLVNKQVDQEHKGLELSIIRDLAHTMFTPEKIIHTQQLVPQALAFVRELKSQGYKLYILSNFSPETFRLLEDTYPELFTLFDGIVVSGDIGMIKPDQAIYEYTLATHNIDRNKACFIDDQLTNINAAQAVGIKSFLCPIKKGYLWNRSPDIDVVKEKFYSWRKNLVGHHRTATA